MGNGKVINMNKNQQKPQLNIDPSKLDTVRCENCDGILFEEVMMFKEIPAVKSPNGQKSMLPIPVIRCVDCGNISERFLPKELLS